MKTYSYTLALTALLAGHTLALAGPFNRQHVAAEAKWIAHFDVDNFRSTRVGDWVAREQIEREMAKVQADLKTFLDFDFDWRHIHALTAYGLDYQPPGKAEGVLLIHTGLDVQTALETVIEKQAQAGVTGGNVQRLASAPVPIYSIRQEFVAALPPGQPVVLAKTQTLLQKGLSVLAGQIPSLGTSPLFTDFPVAPNAFAFLGLAAGFNENTPVPPQAQILKLAEGGRLILGEHGDQVFAQLTLKTRTAEASQQAQQLAQGMLALASLSQPNDQVLQQLARATKVYCQDRLVTVDVQLPTSIVLEKIQAEHRRRTGN